MSDKILIREVDKEIENIGYSDIVFFGDNDLYHRVLDEFSTYQNHFPLVTFQKGGGYNEYLIQKTLDKGAIAIIFGSKPMLPTITNKATISNSLTSTNYSGALLGFQRHLCSVESLINIENSELESFSLGKLEKDVSMVEPIMRQLEMLVVDLSVLSSVFAPNISGSKITGMDAGTLIQLVKFVSHGPDFKILCFDFSDLTSGHKEEVEVMACCLWYLAEGLHQGKYTIDPNDEQYHVELDDFNATIVFLHSSKFNKWWVKLEGEEKWLPCSQKEYEDTSSGILPDRLLTLLSA